MANRARPISWLLAACLLGSLAGPAAAADTLELKDGRKLDGVIVAESADGITFRSGSSVRFYASADVAKLERGVTPPAPDGPPAGTAGASGEGTPPTSTPPAAEPPKKSSKQEGKRPKALTDASRAWVREIAGRAATDDEIVRRSVAAALRACGPAAVPTIREVADAATDPALRMFLSKVAEEMAPSRKSESPPKGDAPEGAPKDGMGPGAMGPGATGSDDPGAPGAPGAGDKKAPADGTPSADRPEGKRKMGPLQRVFDDLEIRDDQRTAFTGVVLAFEKSRGQAIKKAQDENDLSGARALLSESKTRTLAEAKAILDEGQMALFDEIVERRFIEFEMKLSKKNPDAPK